MPYEGKVRYDYELKNLTENKKEIPESGKKKKNFWDHYDK